MKAWMLTAVALAVGGAALARIPAPVLDDAAKAKAAETAAKAAWQAKLDLYQLCKAQDRVAAYYRKTAGSKAATPPAGTTSAAATPVAANAATASPAAAATPAATTPVAAAAAGAASAAKSAAMPASSATTPTQGAATPAAAVVAAPNISLAACTDPGPFAYAPPDQKPLETSGAHSPAPTAASPPSVRQEAATMKPAKPGTASKP
jgi:hypothetical protein